MNMALSNFNQNHYKMTTGFIEDEQGLTGVVGMILSFGVYDDSHDSNEESFSYDDGLVKRYYEIAPYYCVVDENGPVVDENDTLKVFPILIGGWGHKPTIGLIKLIEEEIDRMFSINY